MPDEYDNETGEILMTQHPVQLDYQSGPELWAAFCKAQMAMEQPQKTKTASVRPREGAGYSFAYAPLDEIIRCCQKPLNENDLIFTQAVIARNGSYMLRTKIIHTSGQWFGNDYPLFTGRGDAQGFGGGTTYSRRYGLMLALGMAAEDDDDANASVGNQREIADRKPATQQQRPPYRQQETQKPNGAADAARAAVQRIRARIDAATTTTQLDDAWTAADEKAIKSQNQGERVWQGILDREAAKRMEIVEADQPPMDGPPDDFMSEQEAGDVFQRR